jgi:hypothetical protein
MSNEDSNVCKDLQTTFTAKQIMALQAQVKSFKELSGKYQEFEISKVIERLPGQIVPPIPLAIANVTNNTSGGPPVSVLNNMTSSRPLPLPPMTSSTMQQRKPSVYTGYTSTTHGPSGVTHPSTSLSMHAVMMKPISSPLASHVTTSNVIPSALPYSSSAPSSALMSNNTLKTVYNPTPLYPTISTTSVNNGDVPVSHPTTDISTVNNGHSTTTMTTPLGTTTSTSTSSAIPTTPQSWQWQCFGSLLFSAPNTTGVAAEARRIDNLETLSVSYQVLRYIITSPLTSIYYMFSYLPIPLEC